MSKPGSREADLRREGGIEERSRVLRIVRGHMSEFASRDVEVDKRVAAALEEIATEIQKGTAL